MEDKSVSYGRQLLNLACLTSEKRSALKGKNLLSFFPFRVKPFKKVFEVECKQEILKIVSLVKNGWESVEYIQFPKSKL